MIRVLHILHGMNRGGTETMIMNYYRNIDRNKIQFDFLLTNLEKCDYEDEILTMGGRITRITPLTIKTIHKYILDICKFFKQNREYKICHSHTSSKSAFPLAIAKLYNIPVRVCHSHNNKSEYGIKGVVRDILKIPLKFVSTDYFACSEEAAKWLYGNRFYRKGKHIVLKNAIDLSEFIYSKDSRNEIRKEFNLSEDNFVLGNIARFNEQKNHLFLLDIFKEVYLKNSKARLLLVGDGNLRPIIEKKIEEYNLQDVCILTGVRSDTQKLLQAMDAFVLPSLYEGLGIVLIEAQASGMKSYTSNGVVSKEAKVTDLLEYIGLEEDPYFWAEKILHESVKYEREDLSKQIKNNGYCIKENAKWLEKFYINKGR